MNDFIDDLKVLPNLDANSYKIIALESRSAAKQMRRALAEFFNIEVIINELNHTDREPRKVYHLLAPDADRNLALFMQGYALALVAQQAAQDVIWAVA